MKFQKKHISNLIMSNTKEQSSLDDTDGRIDPLSGKDNWENTSLAVKYECMFSVIVVQPSITDVFPRISGGFAVFQFLVSCNDESIC